MMFSKLCLLIFCLLGGKVMGMMVGGFRPISLSKVTELPYYRNVEGSIRKNLRGEGNPKLSFLPIKLECASRQLVNGLNWKVYFSVGEAYQCKVQWYISFYNNEPNDFHVTCSDDTDANFCAGNQRSRRSLSEENSYPTLLSMEKEGKKGDRKLLGLFEVFNFHYNRTYGALDSELYQKKYETFSQNWEVIKHLNSIERGSAVYGMTKFMDYTSEEFKKHFAPGLKPSLVETPRLADTSMFEATKMPDSADWRKKGAVTPVKNQGECGSCWAFSTTGNVEGQWFVKTGKLLSLSEQELVDCDALDDGCQGGLPSNAYKSIQKLGGLEIESDYPYDGRDEQCNINKTKLGVYVNDSISLPTDEVKIAKWIAQHGPVSIGINANLMQFYFGGISHPWKIFCNPKSLDHGVLIVGYGTEDDKPYWIIKNSWGPDWGEEGYYRIYRGDGSCGVNQMVTSAIIN